MPDELITSRQNPLVKSLAQIRDDRDSPLMFLEGPRLVAEVLKSKRPLEILIWTKSIDGDPVLEEARNHAKKLFRVSDPVFQAVSDVDAPQGILAIARCPNWTWEDLLKKAPAPLLVLDGIQDPGNVAAIVRAAEASGAAGIVTTPGTAHLFAPKALRGAAGSTLRLPCLEHLQAIDIASRLKKANYQLFAAAAREKSADPVCYTDIPWDFPQAFLLGKEGKGLSDTWGSAIDRPVYIPMEPPVESLNVAAAAAILLYESRKHRTN